MATAVDRFFVLKKEDRISHSPGKEVRKGMGRVWRE